MSKPAYAAQLSLRTKVLGSVAAVGTTATVAGLGTFGAFSSTTSASIPTNSGRVVIEMGAAGTPANRLTVGATGLVPGDTVQRAVQLTNSGDQSLSSITLTTTASPSSLLDTDSTNGLQLLVQSCPTAWTEAGTAPAFTYSCSGATTTVLASRPVIGSNLALSGLASTAPSGTDHLRVTLTFPSAAGNTLQGLNSTITFSFTGTQRTATTK